MPSAARRAPGADRDGGDPRLVDPARVAAARSVVPAPELVEDLAGGVFGMLADENRLRLLIALTAVDELCVSDLAAVAGLSESATSHALRLLRAHRVVKVRREGRLAHYSLDDGHVRVLLDVALEHQRHGR